MMTDNLQNKWLNVSKVMEQNYMELNHAKAEATQLLELLREIDRDCGFCPVCKSYEISNAGEKVHRDGCKLAKKLNL